MGDSTAASIRNSISDGAPGRVYRRLLLQHAPNWLRKRHGDMTLESIDLGPLDRLRRTSTEDLRDVRLLEAKLLPALGLADDAPDVFPSDLHAYLGHGLRCWQYPIQLAPYLRHLLRYPVRSYLELGTAHGGTFVVTSEYLRRLGQLQEATAVDLRYVPSLQRYARRDAQVEFVQFDSNSAEFREFLGAKRLDLVLIDGDHSEEACRRDFELFRPRSKMIAFHDIVDEPSPGVGRVWESIQHQMSDEYNFYEFAAQYEEVKNRFGKTLLGIGLAVRKDYDTDPPPTA